jgi:cryptochrome
MKVFEEYSLDADWSVNAGMWLWLSCSSFFQQFFHCYCPVKFGRKADPNGDYIRKYVPVLRNFPTKYIHEPWMANESIQKAAKCIIGKDYPVAIIDHVQSIRVNRERMRLVFQQLSKYRPRKYFSIFNSNFCVIFNAYLVNQFQLQVFEVPVNLRSTIC